MISIPARRPHNEIRRSLSLTIGLFFMAGFLAASTAAALGAQPQAESPPPKISARASARCTKKVAELQEFAADKGSLDKKTTRLTEEELNSYMALELKSKYHPCLQSLQISFEENKLSGVATIDFDNLSLNSTKSVTRLLTKLLSGVHSLSMEGKLEASGGKANFVLGEARFDSTVLPNFLVEEIITAVGKKQKPPFDPIQPTQMPFKIDKVEVHKGHIIIIQ
jgi:hypothetical protein